MEEKIVFEVLLSNKKIFKPIIFLHTTRIKTTIKTTARQKRKPHTAFQLIKSRRPLLGGPTSSTVFGRDSIFLLSPLQSTLPILRLRRFIPSIFYASATASSWFRPRLSKVGRDLLMFL